MSVVIFGLMCVSANFASQCRLKVKRLITDLRGFDGAVVDSHDLITSWKIFVRVSDDNF